MTNSTIVDYINQLIIERGVTGVDEEILAQMKLDLISRVEERLNFAILESLSPDKLPEFEKVFNSGDLEAVQQFLKSNISDMDQLIAKVLLDFRLSYLGV